MVDTRKLATGKVKVSVPCTDRVIGDCGYARDVSVSQLSCEADDFRLYS